MANNSQLAVWFFIIHRIWSCVFTKRQIYSCRADATCDSNEEISFHKSIRGVKRSPRRGRRLSNVANAVSIIPSNVAAWICAPNEKLQDFVIHYSIRRVAHLIKLEFWSNLKNKAMCSKKIIQHYRNFCNISKFYLRHINENQRPFEYFSSTFIESWKRRKT